MVEEHEVVGLLPYRLYRVLAGEHKVGGYAEQLEQVVGDLEVHREIIDYQHLGADYLRERLCGVLPQARPHALLVIPDRLGVNYGLFQSEREGAPVAIDALYFQLAAHHFQQAGDYRHTEACTLDSAVLLLFEALERHAELIHILLADSDTGVAYRHIEQHRAVLAAAVLYRELYFALFGVFHGVGEEVHYHLRHAHIVSEQHRRELLIYIGDEGQALCARPLGYRVHEVVYHQRELIVDGDYLHFPVLYLREVKYRIYQREQVLARRLYVGGIFEYSAVLRLAQYHLVHTEHGVYRRSYLVGHTRQKLALGLVGVVGNLYLLFERR